MPKTQPEKLDILIKAWLDEAVRDEVIPTDYRGRLEGIGDPGCVRHAELEAAATEMAAD